MIPNIWHPTSEICYLIYDIGCMISDTWHMGDFTQGGEWLLKNVTIFFYGDANSSLKINIDSKQPTCMYQLRFSRGPHDLF